MIILPRQALENRDNQRESTQKKRSLRFLAEACRVPGQDADAEDYLHAVRVEPTEEQADILA
jgi:hypothetical protein